MTQTIGFIGAGPIGTTLAKLALAAGLEVVVSNSRGPETLADVVADLGEGARAATAADTAKVSDLVVIAIPLNVYDKLSARDLAGKIVVDTMNYYPQRDGHIAQLDRNELTSSELVQRHLPDSTVIKALNILDYFRLGKNARPKGDPERSALPVAGDDEAAKSKVIAFMDAIGYDAVDVGPLSESWRQAPGMPIYVFPYLAMRPEGLTSREEERRWFLDTPSATVTAEEAKKLLAQAERGVAGGIFIPGYVYPPPAP
jgi:predicted dinucleotide-binding enzyme